MQQNTPLIILNKTHIHQFLNTKNKCLSKYRFVPLLFIDRQSASISMMLRSIPSLQTVRKSQEISIDMWTFPLSIAMTSPSSGVSDSPQWRRLPSSICPLLGSPTSSCPPSASYCSYPIPCWVPLQSQGWPRVYITYSFDFWVYFPNINKLGM